MEQATSTYYIDDPYVVVREAARYVCVSPASMHALDNLLNGRLLPCEVEWEPMLGTEAPGKTFQRDEFQLSLLQSIGGLKVVWTDKMDDHLGLFTAGSGDSILKLYWFYNDWSVNFNDSVVVDDQWTEANKTLLWILGSNQRVKPAKGYWNIRLPDWYCGYSGQPDPTRLKYDNIMCNDVRPHLRLDGWELLPKQIPYSDYPHYEKKIRELKHYMDSQAPTGLRGLWRDKRNSYSFYTLWLVVIFGGFSILLALASLVVSSL